MKPTFEQAESAAKIIRQYMNGEKHCRHWNSKEADEISNCVYPLQEWSREHGQFKEEHEYAHRVAVNNYHMEEASVGDI